MASYRVSWRRSAAKEVRNLPKDALLRILQAVEQLATDPYPRGVRKLVGADQTFRIREGSYRIIYSVFDDVCTVEIVRVRHRKDAYGP